MAEEIHHPHDLIVRAVLSDLTEASSFLRAHLPDEVSQGLNWSTLRLVESSFVDEDLGYPYNRCKKSRFHYHVKSMG